VTAASPRAAWIGAPDAALPDIRSAFRRELCAALRAAFPAARVALLDGGVRVEVKAPGCRPVRIHEPDYFWGHEVEAVRIARAVAVVREELAR
jgi:hypothetical protein